MPPGHARRFLDVVVSALTLALLSPLLLLIALAIRAGSRGPVLFRQSRVGQGGVLFTMYKFRTMRDDVSGPGVTVVGDTRVTPLGGALRASSLDELPQFFNVLRGDMTLVGMRPEVPALAARYPPEWQSLFAYRPGLTGPSQVQLRDRLETGPESAEHHYLTQVLPARMALDRDYLAHPTVGRTLALLASTVPHVLARMLPGAVRGCLRPGRGYTLGGFLACLLVPAGLVALLGLGLGHGGW